MIPKAEDLGSASRERGTIGEAAGVLAGVLAGQLEVARLEHRERQLAVGEEAAAPVRDSECVSVVSSRRKYACY